MGKRGPQPKPTAIKLLKGTFRQCRAPKNEPKPKVIAPGCPTWLRKEAKAEWKRLVKELLPDGLVTLRDRSILAALCDAWADFHESEKVLQKEGRTFTTEKGYIGQHPAVAMKNNAREQIRKLGSMFGLSPSSRCQIEKPVDESAEATEAREMLG